MKKGKGVNFEVTRFFVHKRNQKEKDKKKRFGRRCFKELNDAINFATSTGRQYCLPWTEDNFDEDEEYFYILKEKRGTRFPFSKKEIDTFPKSKNIILAFQGDANAIKLEKITKTKCQEDFKIVFKRNTQCYWVYFEDLNEEEKKEALLLMLEQATSIIYFDYLYHEKDLVKVKIKILNKEVYLSLIFFLNYLKIEEIMDIFIKKKLSIHSSEPPHSKNTRNGHILNFVKFFNLHSYILNKTSNIDEKENIIDYIINGNICHNEFMTKEKIEELFEPDTIIYTKNNSGQKYFKFLKNGKVSLSNYYTRDDFIRMSLWYKKHFLEGEQYQKSLNNIYINFFKNNFNIEIHNN